MRHARTVSLVVAAIGLALLVMMIVVEDEPGAIPLTLILVGLVGYFYCRTRQRRTGRRG